MGTFCAQITSVVNIRTGYEKRSSHGPEIVRETLIRFLNRLSPLTESLENGTNAIFLADHQQLPVRITLPLPTAFMANQQTAWLT